MDIPKLEELNASTCTSRVMKVRYPEFYGYIIETYSGIPFTEALYRYYHPNWNNTCIECGKPTKFINLTNGYREFCSQKCCNNSQEIQRRREQSCIDRYGTTNPMAVESVKEKVRETNLTRYGTDNASKSDIIKEKIKKTNLEKYGVTAPLMNPGIMEKSKKTCLEKYGSEYYGCSEEARIHKRKIKKETVEKMRATKIRNMIRDNEDLLDYDGANYTLKCPDPNCNKCMEKYFIIPKTVLYARRTNNIDLCTQRTPLYLSSNTSIEAFVRDILDSHNIEYKTNNRDILEGKELDLYIPSYKIAIECNGIYWHSLKMYDYHYNKWKKCLESGIQLLNIWEDWIANKPEITKSIILSKLGIYERRVGARKCMIKEVSAKDASEFLEANHIQGDCRSGIRIGLYYKDELVSLMTFGKKRRSILGNNMVDESWELTRFCTLRNMQVVGGAEKLLNYFTDIYNPESIVSFASHDISNGNLYEKLGFRQESETISSYWYIHKKTLQRFHRFKFRKSELVRMGYDPTKSENEIMAESDYYKIYDSGQTKYVKIRKAPK